MLTSELKIRVRYSETDQMGYVYYGNYAAYFEVARVEMLRQIGLSYRKLEEEGIMLPVGDYHIRYNKPAYYDDLLTIKTTIRNLPGVKIEFHYETFNEKGFCINTAETTLVFVDIKSGKAVKAPAYFMDVVTPYFREAP